MIKRILKKIIPIKILKSTFLILNGIKINTWDKFFFPEKRIPSNKFLIKEETNPFRVSQVPTKHFRNEIQEKLKLWLDPKWTQDQYFLYFEDKGWIDPLYGWAITESHLLYASLGFSRAPYVRKPSLIGSCFKKKRNIYLQKIISLRDTGEENYFHFYNDVLTKLFFIEDQRYNLTDFTIVITERLFTKEFFQFFYKNTRLRDLNWHVQKDEWIHFSEAIFCKPYTHTKKYLDQIVHLLPPISRKHEPRKIFLTRTKSSLRYIENMDEFRDIVERFRFEIIDASTINVAQQIEIFCDCECLISIHGAGLTNIIFRQGKPLSILEIIQPSDYIPFHYIMLAHQYGYSYNIMLGEKGSQRFEGGFRVNPRVLEVMIKDITVKKSK